MFDINYPRSRHTALTGATVTLAATLSLLSVSASAAPATPKSSTKPPQLSIAVNNGHASAVAGDRLAYTVTVTNLGGAINQLWVTQSVPAGARFGTADAQGRQHAGAITWRVKVKASGKAVLHTTMTVAAHTPQDLMRLATVTCAKVSAKGPPLVCAADSDQLPAGAAAEATAARAAAPAGLWTRLQSQAVVVGAAAVGMALVVAFLIRRRRRRRRRKA